MEKKLKTRYSIRFRNTTDNDLIEFASLQTNFTDTIRYLIEKEIYSNGIRNLQEFIPTERDEKYFKKTVKEGNVNEWRAITKKSNRKASENG